MRFVPYSFNIKHLVTGTIADTMTEGHKRGMAADMPIKTVYLDHRERTLFFNLLKEQEIEFKEGMHYYGMQVFSE